MTTRTSPRPCGARLIIAMTILIEGFYCNCNYYLNYCHYFTKETSMLKLQNLFHLQTTSFWHPSFNAEPNHRGCQESEAVDMTVPAPIWSVRNSKATCFLVSLPTSCWSKWSHRYLSDCKIFSDWLNTFQLVLKLLAQQQIPLHISACNCL